MKLTKDVIATLMKKEEVKNDEDKTKLFFDENVLKKPFEKRTINKK